MTPSILVAGLGNVLMSDDAIGPYAARSLTAHYEFPPHVEVADLGTPGLDLTVHLADADIVLLIDALRGVAPGTIAVYDDAALSIGAGRETRLETHSPAIAESVQIARLTGDRPRHVWLIGLTGVSFEQGTSLSPDVQARLPALIECVLAQLTSLDVAWTPRARPAPLDVWWEEPRCA